MKERKNCDEMVGRNWVNRGFLLTLYTPKAIFS